MTWHTYLQILTFDKVFMVVCAVALLGRYWWNDRKHGKGKW